MERVSKRVNEKLKNPKTILYLSKYLLTHNGRISFSLGDRDFPDSAIFQYIDFPRSQIDIIGYSEIDSELRSSLNSKLMEEFDLKTSAHNLSRENEEEYKHNIKELLSENIIFTVSQESGWIDVDLSQYNIVLNNKIALSVEWIKIYGVNEGFEP